MLKLYVIYFMGFIAVTDYGKGNSDSKCRDFRREK